MHKPYDPVRRRLLLGAAALIAGPALSRRVASADFSRPIEVGIFPYLPTATLITGFQPLRRFFEETFKRPAALSTAPDFRGFHRRTLAGDFDVVITGAPLGWHAHFEAKFHLLAVSDSAVRLYILVARDSPIKSIADLRGKTLATIDPMTFTAQTTVTTLREAGLVPGVDVLLHYEKTPFNSAQAVALGEVAAAGFPNLSYPNLPAEIRGKLRILHETAGVPGILFLARAAPDMPRPDEFQAALLRFVRETEAGRAFVREFNLDGLSKPDLKTLRVLDRYLPELQRLMATP